MIYSQNFDKHLHYLEDVFLRLPKAHIRLKPSKCFFSQDNVKYLGHIVSRNGICPNPDKVSAVTEFPVPKNTKGVRSFLGLANYYRRFIQGFSKLAAPLNQLQRKCVCLKWASQNTFDAFKHALVTVPVLAFRDFSQPFDLYVDASLEGIGMTLGQTQKGHEVAIAYGGRDLTPVERNYSATEHEALTVVPMPFKWLMTVKDPTGRLARWSLLLQQFDFTIHHRAGKSNGNADALS